MTYTLMDGFIKQDAKMNIPDILSPVYNTHEDMSDYDTDMDDYNSYILSLKSYPILPGSEWLKKEGLVEGKDFDIVCMHCLNGMTLDGHIATQHARPRNSLREEPQERDNQGELWEILRSTFEEHIRMGSTGTPIILVSAITELNQHYNISKK